MPNFNQAPLLEFSQQKDTIPSEWSWVIPNTLVKCTFTKLSKLNEIKLMMFLLGQSDKPSYKFAVAEKTVLEATGMDHKAYIKAREGLIEKGWITLIPKEKLIINVENIIL